MLRIAIPLLVYFVLMFGRLKSGDTVSPYDLRRSYAQWLDLARTPQFRQDYYMAHGPRDLNTLYKRMRDVSGYLREDAASDRRRSEMSVTGSPRSPSSRCRSAGRRG